MVTEKDVVRPGNGTGLKRSIWTASPPARWFIAEQCSDISPQINYSWEDVSPGCSVSNDFWNMRWEGFVQAQFTETYTIYVTANDLARVWINDQLVVDAWNSTATGNTITGTIALTANQLAAIKVDFAEKNGNAGIVLEWSSASTPREIIPQAQLYPEKPSSIRESLSTFAFKIYPNPASEWITIDSPDVVVERVQLISLQGQVVWSSDEPFRGSKLIRMDLPKGIYFIKINEKIHKIILN